MDDGWVRALRILAGVLIVALATLGKYNVARTILFAVLPIILPLLFYFIGAPDEAGTPMTLIAIGLGMSIGLNICSRTERTIFLSIFLVGAFLEMLLNSSSINIFIFYGGAIAAFYLLFKFFIGKRGG
ncbi:hypothetical protein [Deinococcus sp. RL]|uniref:hypothetical protein n=1 Tax=Deinococcus sp. RL TaxID=1489678 RepID=UPI001267EC62|nr:hypothetical protein [Deinococcus sp. RL]